MTSQPKIYFHWNAWEDYIYWRSNDNEIFSQINLIIQNISSKLSVSIQQPLAKELRGFFSRRICGEHKLVYTFKNNDLIIASCRCL